MNPWASFSLLGLLLYLCCDTVFGDCSANHYCDDPLEILNLIKTYPDNYQQLLNAFYPINQAKPSNVIIVYFTNHTELDPLPKECSSGTYPWTEYPEEDWTIVWQMWTTSPIYSVCSDYTFLEFGEYLPTLSYTILLDKTSPFVLPIPIACIKCPLIANYNVLGFVTTQVASVILHKRYDGKLFESLYMRLTNIYDARIKVQMVQAESVDGDGTKEFFNTFLSTVGLLVPYLVNTVGRLLMVNLQQKGSEGKLPFFWAASTLSHFFNIYMIGKYVLTWCPDHTWKGCSNSVMIVAFSITSCGVIAGFHSNSFTVPVPKLWTICMKGWCGKKQHRVLITASLWGLYCSLGFLSLSLPYQVLMVIAKPHWYGFGILTVWSVLLVCITMMSILYTIDQVFSEDKNYRISYQRALQQILLQVYISILVFGFGSLTFCIVCIIHLSKFGEKTQSISSSIYFIARYVVIPMTVLLGRKIMKKIKPNYFWQRLLI